MDLDGMLAKSAFEHGRTCRFDRHGRAVVHEQPEPLGEAALSLVIAICCKAFPRLSTGRR